MVGQAAKAADMRAGNVPKPGMKSMNGGGGSMSVSTQKYKPPEVEKAKPKPKAVSHSQMAMEWEANGRDKNGKLIKHVDKPKGWTKDDVNRARDRALEEQRRAAAGPVMTDAADAGEEVESAPDGEPAHVLARARMGELALALQGLAVDEGAPPPSLPPPPPPLPMAASASISGADSSGADSSGAGGSGAGSSGAECSFEGEGASREQLWAVAEGRRAQLDELECLQAMFPDEFLLVTPPDAVAAFRERCDALGEDAASAEAAALRAVAAHGRYKYVL